jgi:hypothetical protein
VTSYASDTSSTRLKPEFTCVIPPGFVCFRGHPSWCVGDEVIVSWKSNMVTVQTEKSSVDPLLVIGALLAVLAIVVAMLVSVWDFNDDAVTNDESFPLASRAYADIGETAYPRVLVFAAPLSFNLP